MYHESSKLTRFPFSIAENVAELNPFQISVPHWQIQQSSASDDIFDSTMESYRPTETSQAIKPETIELFSKSDFSCFSDCK